jgi:hypothetical protein
MIDSQKGSVLIIVITGITIIAAIGAGVATMISSGARTGANHSLSVQARYAAESGFEWAGSKLRSKVGSWASYCENEGLKEEDLPQFDSVSFSIEKTTKILNDDNEPIGCEVTVSGWVGSDEDNFLAKRQIKGKVPKSFIEADPESGPDSGPNLVPPEDWLDRINEGCEAFDICYDDTTPTGINEDKINNKDVYVGNESERIEITGDINLEFQGQGGHALIKGVNVTGGVNIAAVGGGGNNRKDVYIEDADVDGDIIINHSGQGNVYIGNDVSTGGRIIINISGGGEVCIGSMKNVGNHYGYSHDVVINISGNGHVCIGDDDSLNDADVNISGGQGSVCFVSANNVNDDCCSICDFVNGGGGDMNQNPVGTEDGSWTEG